MPEPRDLPTGTAEESDTYNSQVEDISNLLDDPETDLEKDEKDQAKAAPEDPDDTRDDDAEDVETVDDEDPDGSSEPEVKGGRFAPDSAKVTLDDGTVISVSELKRGHLFQRDYTKKTTELSAEREHVTAQRQEVDQYAQSLNQARDYLQWYAETYTPKRPEAFTGNAMSDPAGFIDWQQKETSWRTHQEAYQAFQQQKAYDEQHRQGETQQQANTKLQREANALAEVFPVLKNPEKRKGFWDRLEAGAQKHFGITAEEVRSVGDRRMIQALHAAVAQKRLEEKASQVRDEVGKRPPLKGGRRGEPQKQETRGKQARTERLRERGTFEDGVASLMDLNL